MSVECRNKLTRARSRQLPRGRCELHRGSFEDRAGRTLDRLLGRIGRRLKRIFE